MDKIDELIEMGKASKKALEFARTVVKPGASLLDVAQELEAFIIKSGFKSAFPVNLSIGNVAAHYTPTFNDTRKFGEKDLVKVDLGLRSEESLTDTALTIDLSGENSKLVEASEKALQNALSMVKAGRKVTEIGREIEKTAKEYGFTPVHNLGGHGIETGNLHAEVFIPNYDNGDETELYEGQSIAIEPFITNGHGLVHNGEVIEIFQMNALVNLRSPESRRIVSFIETNYDTYPFAMRWLVKETKASEFSIRRAIKEILESGALEEFPILVEKEGSLVSQAEKQVIVKGDSFIEIT